MVARGALGLRPGACGGDQRVGCGTDNERTPAFWPAMPLEGRGGEGTTGVTVMGGVAMATAAVDAIKVVLLQHWTRTQGVKGSNQQKWQKVSFNLTTRFNWHTTIHTLLPGV